MPSILASHAGSSISTKRPHDAVASRPSSKRARRALHLATPHPNGIKPSGNALLGPPSIRPSGLGAFSRLDDEALLVLLSSFFSFVDAGNDDDDDGSRPTLGERVLGLLARCSKTLYLFVTHEPLWRQALQARLSILPTNSPQRTLKAWRGTWRRTYISHLHADSAVAMGTSPRLKIRLANLYSDVLFHPFLLSTLPMEPYIPSPSAKGRSAFVPLPRIKASDYTPLRFFNDFARRNTPCIILEDASEASGVSKPFEAWSCARWDMDSAFAPRGTAAEESGDNWSGRTFQCEAWRCVGQAYREYSKCCERLARRAVAFQEEAEEEEERKGDASFDPEWVADESPFYLFDPVFASDERARQGWRVPELLKVAPKQGSNWRPDEEEEREEEGKIEEDEKVEMGQVEADLFSLLGEQRPDFRWIIAGPARSGSGWHKDPNMTSAWNTVLCGRKAWLMLPPGTCPPGVFITQDEAEVTAPLSIVEWLMDYHAEARRLHGPEGDGTLLEGVCERGETVYVPAGWWHLVFNVEETVALTQNFVSPSELPLVLDFMKSRPEQISGFKRFDEAGAQGCDGEAAKDSSASSAAAAPHDMDDCDELEESRLFGAAVYALFVDRLGLHGGGELLRWALGWAGRIEERREREGAGARCEMTAGAGGEVVKRRKIGEEGTGRTWWERLKGENGGEGPAKKEGREETSLFGTLGTLVAGEGEELEDVPW